MNFWRILPLFGGVFTIVCLVGVTYLQNRNNKQKQVSGIEEDVL